MTSLIIVKKVRLPFAIQLAEPKRYPYLFYSSKRAVISPPPQDVFTVIERAVELGLELDGTPDGEYSLILARGGRGESFKHLAELRIMAGGQVVELKPACSMKIVQIWREQLEVL